METSIKTASGSFSASCRNIHVREAVKRDVYSKRQTAKMKLLRSVFSSLYSRIKTFVFAVISIIVRDTFLYLCDLFNDYKKRIKHER